MRVPPSTPDNLVRDGASVRLWHDTHRKAKALARLRGKRVAATYDEVIHAALQAEWDRIEAEGDTPEPLPTTD